MEISVVLATFNEEKNLGDCLESVNKLADEIIVVDGGSTDKTVAIAKQYGAKIIMTDNPPIFHLNKQKAISAATKDWILQLDADERVTPELAEEIKQIIKMNDEQINNRSVDQKKNDLFLRHQKILEKRDGQIGTKDGDIVAFFVPRRTYFLNKLLIHGGVYPDGVIRLIKKGKAFFPSKTVHEQIEIHGRVEWLYHDLIHNTYPTLAAYLRKGDTYTSLTAEKFKKEKLRVGVFTTMIYIIVVPTKTFFNLYFRHLGFLDGFIGFLWAIFSALHWPVAYLKYLRKRFT